mmetsp:Transcript_6075/g.27253  ORF Transcript_6075/g.27253 Transcript_6075/m.27253 type:complete len:219 (+) Transcript_6075:1514-2170(+)
MIIQITRILVLLSRTVVSTGSPASLQRGHHGSLHQKVHAGGECERKCRVEHRVRHHVPPSEVIAARRGAGEPLDDHRVHQVRPEREPGERYPPRVRQERVETFEPTRPAQRRHDTETGGPHRSTRGDERRVDPRRPALGVPVVGKWRKHAREQSDDRRGTPCFDRRAVEDRPGGRVGHPPLVDETKRHSNQVSGDPRVRLAVGVVGVVPPRFTEHVAT